MFEQVCFVFLGAKNHFKVKLGYKLNYKIKLCNKNSLSVEVKL